MLRLAELNGFWSDLASARRRCLLLDYDGTLAPFQAERDQAYPYDGVREALRRILAARHSRVVIISGRAAHEIPALLGLELLPEIWGSHGLERISSSGEYEPAVLPEDIAAALSMARQESDARGLDAYIEEKPGCLALHWRGLSQHRIEELRRELLPGWTAIADNSRLQLSEFDGGLELRSELATKANAVTRVLAEESLECSAAYLGDDLTDEDAFAAIAGWGLGVLVREQLRETQASAWLIPPAELLAFLAKWDESCR
jgi:trehalose-phosphatase